MRAWHAFRARLRSIVSRRRREAELAEELQTHLEREAERLRSQGYSDDQAAMLARRTFGGVEQVKEDCRDARGTRVLDALARDVRYGFRRLVRDWQFTTAAVLILGLAIGANTAIFSVVNAVLFRGSAFADADRLVNIYQNDRAGRPLVVTTYDAYQQIAARDNVFSAAAAASIPVPVRYLHEGAVRNALVEFATASYPGVLGLRPSVGRWFLDTEEQRGAPPVVVLGNHVWTRVFGSDPSVLGRTIRIDGVPATIVGVGPADYRATIDVGVATDLWLPVTAMPAIAPAPVRLDSPTIAVPLFVKARLRPDVTVAQAQAAMDLLGRRLAAENPDAYRRGGEFALGEGITVMPASAVRIHPQADGAISALASLVLVIVGLVLAIAGSNLATLLLVRGAARVKEISLRLALGAERRQIVRQLLAESLLLSLAGGVAGALLAWWGTQALQRIDIPFNVDFTLDVRVLAFTLALSLVTGIAFGLAPALKATRVDLLQSLREEGLQPIDRRRLTLRHGLIAFQVAVSVLLLGGTTIFLQHAAAARAHRVGFAIDGVAMIETDLRFSSYSPDAARTFLDGLLRRIESVPGVEAAALLNGLPMAANGVSIVVDGGAAGDTPVEAAMVEAGPAFFDTLRIPLLFGRVFEPRDNAEAPRVAVITDRMARQYFGTVNAVGRRFRLESDPGSWTEVIGVVRDTGTGRFEDDVIDPIAPMFYRSWAQTGTLPTTIVARTAGDAGALLAAMQRELRAADVTLPVLSATTMAGRLQSSQAGPNAVAALLGLLGGLGLLLASIGLYAVVAFAVASRTREIGIRMALGARSRQVVWRIAQSVAGVIGLGTGSGLLLSVAVTLALRAASAPGDIGIGSIAIYRPSIDPVALLAIVAITAAVGVAAAFVPGRRAARMDPLVALRYE